MAWSFPPEFMAPLEAEANVEVVTGGDMDKLPGADIVVPGILPGILLALLFAGYVVIAAFRNPEIAPIPDIHVTTAEKWRSLKGVWGISFQFVLVIGAGQAP